MARFRKVELTSTISLYRVFALVQLFLATLKLVTGAITNNVTSQASITRAHTVPVTTDYVIGIAVTWAEKNDPSTADKLRGYETFLRSIRASTPHAAIYLVADDDIWMAMPDDLRYDKFINRLTVTEVVNALPENGRVPAVWRKTRVQFGRYYLYPAVLKLIRLNNPLLRETTPPIFQRHKLGLNISSPPVQLLSSFPLPRGRNCSAAVEKAVAAEPLVFFSDTRDVIFQRDVFTAARKRMIASATATYCSASPSSSSSYPREWRPTLFVAQEPEQFLVVQNQINIKWLHSCFRESDLKILEGQPILCSGTTLGSWRAAVTYSLAMVRLLGYCLTAQKEATGVDQSVHIMAMAARNYPTALQQQKGLNSIANGNEDAAFSSFMATAKSELLDLVDVVVLRHENNIICTVGLILIGESSLILTFPSNTPSSYSKSTIAITARVGGDACAVVHQYDRHALPVLLAETTFRRGALDFAYCQVLHSNDTMQLLQYAAQGAHEIVLEVSLSNTPFVNKRQDDASGKGGTDNSNNVLCKECWTYTLLQQQKPPEFHCNEAAIKVLQTLVQRRQAVMFHSSSVTTPRVVSIPALPSQVESTLPTLVNSGKGDILPNKRIPIGYVDDDLLEDGIVKVSSAPHRQRQAVPNADYPSPSSGKKVQEQHATSALTILRNELMTQRREGSHALLLPFYTYYNVLASDILDEEIDAGKSSNTGAPTSTNPEIRHDTLRLSCSEFGDALLVKAILDNFAQNRRRVALLQLVCDLSSAMRRLRHLLQAGVMHLIEHVILQGPTPALPSTIADHNQMAGHPTTDYSSLLLNMRDGSFLASAVFFNATQQIDQQPSPSHSNLDYNATHVHVRLLEPDTVATFQVDSTRTLWFFRLPEAFDDTFDDLIDSDDVADLTVEKARRIVFGSLHDTLIRFHSASTIHTVQLPHVIYINLDHREDRRTAMEARLAKAGWPKSRVHRLSATYNKTHGMVGCNDSHQRALALAISRRWPSVLIFEDDVEFRSPPAPRIKSFLKWVRASADPWTAAIVSGVRRNVFRETGVVCPLHVVPLLGSTAASDKEELTTTATAIPIPVALVKPHNERVAVAYGNGTTRWAMETGKMRMRGITGAIVGEAIHNASLASREHATAIFCALVPPSLRYAQNYQTTAGYLLSSRYYPSAFVAWTTASVKLAEMPERHAQLSLDQAWKVLQLRDKWYRFDPLLANQGYGLSDITQLTANYSDSFGAWEYARDELEVGRHLHYYVDQSTKPYSHLDKSTDDE